MDEGDLYRHKTTEVDDLVYQEDAEKAETDYDLFL